MNITKTILLLDELRGKALQGNGDEKRSYLIALDANFPVLRQSALDSERYRKAGEELVRTIQNISQDGAVKSLIATTANSVLTSIDVALYAYRQAVEQKEV